MHFTSRNLNGVGACPYDNYELMSSYMMLMKHVDVMYIVNESVITY